MRDVVASVCQLLGLGSIVVAAFLFSTVVGLVVAGVVLLAVGAALDPMLGRR